MASEVSSLSMTLGTVPHNLHAGDNLSSSTAWPLFRMTNWARLGEILMIRGNIKVSNGNAASHGTTKNHHYMHIS